MKTTSSSYHNDYASRGWHLFPLYPIDNNGQCACGDPECGSPGKHPLGTLVPNGLANATTDTATILQWWSIWPDAHTGIRTGALSGIIVMDVDAGNGGWDSIDQLETEHGTIPSTPTVATGGGGAHVYFRHPGGMVPNSAGRIAPGIDLRGDGGYVVAPPSLHVSGATYTWADGFSPDAVPLAPAPSWLLSCNGQRNGSPQLQQDEELAEGGRNDRLMRLGAAFRRYGMTRTEIGAALQAINTARCRPPLDAEEIDRIASSVARYQPEVDRHPRLKPGGKRRKGVRILNGEVVAA